MQTKVIKLDSEKPDLAAIKEASELIAAGGLAAIPTETVYGIACRVETSSLARLNKLKGRSPEKYYTLHLYPKEEIEKYVPTIGLQGRKLIKNALPGPLTIVFELSPQDISKQRNSLQRDVFENLYKDNSIGIRCPDHAIASRLLELTACPVVAPSANLTGKPPAVNAEEVIARFSGQIELVLDGGECRYKASSSVVKVGKKGIEILRSGAYPQAELEDLLQIKFLFVCTGNTCRSPIATGLFSKYLAEKIGCGVDQLEEIGYKILSAGTMGMTGVPASAEAIIACAARGRDITAHRSTALTKKLVEDCDFVFVMSSGHRQQILALSPVAADKCFLLAENFDIPDPIGQFQEVYDSCADLIEKAIKKRIGELVI
jgi:tRNA threonylcarbamoyl adenosine modification protein (Sua5/YciO/YrdC/YwlC family)